MNSANGVSGRRTGRGSHLYTRQIQHKNGIEVFTRTNPGYCPAREEMKIFGTSFSTSRMQGPSVVRPYYARMSVCDVVNLRSSKKLCGNSFVVSVTPGLIRRRADYGPPARA
jgi:hypothetical protein